MDKKLNEIHENVVDSTKINNHTVQYKTRENLIPTNLTITQYNAKSYNTIKHKHTLKLPSLLSRE